MKAIRQFVKVKNRQINIVLPDDFNAEEVEVIILSKSKDYELSEEEIAILENRLNEPETDYISSEESLELLDNFQIPQWHIDEVQKRTEEYQKNPDIALDFDKAIKDIEDEL